MMITGFAAGISTKVSMLTSEPQPVPVQNSCAHSVDTDTSLALRTQSEPLAARLTELSKHSW